MKTTLVLATLLLMLSIPAHAKGPRGGGGEPKRGGRESQPRPASTGLQLSSGLQLSGGLDAASLSPRLSEEDWRKTFVRKEPAK